VAKPGEPVREAQAPKVSDFLETLAQLLQSCQSLQSDIQELTERTNLSVRWQPVGPEGELAVVIQDFPDRERAEVGLKTFPFEPQGIDNPIEQKLLGI
jgi:hypothetical protein